MTRRERSRACSREMATRPAAIRTGNGSGFMVLILPDRAPHRPPEAGHSTLSEPPPSRHAYPVNDPAPLSADHGYALLARRCDPRRYRRHPCFEGTRRRVLFDVQHVEGEPVGPIELCVDAEVRPAPNGRDDVVVFTQK